MIHVTQIFVSSITTLQIDHDIPKLEKSQWYWALIETTELHLDVSENRGTPKWMVYDGKTY